MTIQYRSQPQNSRPLMTLALAAAIGVWGSACLADVFIFKDGRVVSGAVTKENKKIVDGVQETVWNVEVEPNVFIQVYESSLARAGRETLTDAERTYAERLRNLPESAEGHFQMAGWCGAPAQGLKDLANAHYLRVLDLNPNHEGARAATGFLKDADGRWVKQAKIMEEHRGKVLSRGSWRYPEELVIEKGEEERKAKLVAATKDIPRWHSEAVSGAGGRRAGAIQNLEQLSDPLCVGMLAEILQGKRRPVAGPDMRIFYLRILSRMPSAEAARLAAFVSINDADPSVRNFAMDSIHADYRPVVRGVFLGYLRHAENPLVNRAAEALAQFGGDESVLPLINALVTEHVQTVGGGNTNYNPGAMTFGGKPQSVKVKLQNTAVLGALTGLTAQNFQYDQDAWLGWFARLHAPAAADLRRDL